MNNIFQLHNPVINALYASLFTWFITAVGAAGVFLFSAVKQKFLDAMLGFTAGVMIAASFWSLLSPAITMNKLLGNISWLAPMMGFLTGGAFLFLIDKIVPHLHIGENRARAEGLKTGWRKTFLWQSPSTTFLKAWLSVSPSEPLPLLCPEPVFQERSPSQSALAFRTSRKVLLFLCHLEGKV